jgi:ribonuclease VapC
MIVDSSAILAILYAEEDAPRFAAAIAEAEECRMSPVNWLEAVMSACRRGGLPAVGPLDDLVREARIRIEPITEEQAALARHATMAFGRGRHAAALNLGDCFAYALAKASAEPLLYKGDDFGRTDVTPAL